MERLQRAGGGQANQDKPLDFDSLLEQRKPFDDMIEPPSVRSLALAKP